MSKLTLAAAAIIATAVTPAFAQSNAPSTSPAINAPPAVSAPASSTSGVGEFLQQQNPREWRASKLVGSTVMGPDNVRIGDINDVVLDTNGNTNAIVIGVGGFLGVGEKEVAVPFKSISVVPTPAGDKIDKITVNLPTPLPTSGTSQRLWSIDVRNFANSVAQQPDSDAVPGSVRAPQ